MSGGKNTRRFSAHIHYEKRAPKSILLVASGQKELTPKIKFIQSK